MVWEDRNRCSWVIFAANSIHSTEEGNFKEYFLSVNWVGIKELPEDWECISPVEYLSSIHKALAPCSVSWNKQNKRTKHFLEIGICLIIHKVDQRRHYQDSWKIQARHSMWHPAGHRQIANTFLFSLKVYIVSLNPSNTRKRCWCVQRGRLDTLPRIEVMAISETYLYQRQHEGSDIQR